MAIRLAPVSGGGFNAARHIGSPIVPPPPSSPSPKNSSSSSRKSAWGGSYAIDNEENDFNNYERNNKVSDLDARINALMSAPSKKISPNKLQPLSKTTTPTNSNLTSTTPKRIKSSTKEFTCPQCGRSDFPSKVLWKSHCRRCRKKDDLEAAKKAMSDVQNGIPPSPSNAKALDAKALGKAKGTNMGIGGFGKMGLLSQIRKMEQIDAQQRILKAQQLLMQQQKEKENEELRKIQEWEDKKNAKEIEKKAAEERYRIEMEARRLEEIAEKEKLQAEKTRLLDLARKRKAMESKQVEFSKKLKEAAANGDRDALNNLINDVKGVGMDPNDPVVVQAQEVKKQLDQILELRSRVAAAREFKIKQEQEEELAKERSDKQAKKNRRKEKLKNGADSDDTDSDREDIEAEDTEEIEQRRKEAERKQHKREQRAQKRAALKRARALRQKKQNEAMERAAGLAESSTFMIKSEAASLAAQKRLGNANDQIAKEKERIARLQEVVQREKERKEASLKMQSMQEEQDLMAKRALEEQEKFNLEKLRLENEQKKEKDKRATLKKKKKSDEKALQNLIKMQAKGLQAATTAKTKMSKLAQEQKEIARKANQEKLIYEQKHLAAETEAENIRLMLEKQKKHAEEMKEDHQLEIDLRERRLTEAREREEEARNYAQELQLEAEKKEKQMEEKEAQLHFETTAMKKKVHDLEAKDEESRKLEKVQMETLIKREKELEKLRMDQWREKSAMMEQMKQAEQLAEQKLKLALAEASKQAMEKELRMKEELNRKSVENNEIATLTDQAKEADRRSKALEDEFTSKEKHLKGREEQLKVAFVSMRKEMDTRLQQAAAKQAKEGKLQRDEIEAGKKLIDQGELALIEKERVMKLRLEEEYKERLKERELEFIENMKHSKEIEEKLKRMELQLKEGKISTEAERAQQDLDLSEEKLIKMEDERTAAKIAMTPKGQKKSRKGGTHFFPDDDVNDDKEIEQDIDTMDDDEIDRQLEEEEIKTLETNMKENLQNALNKSEKERTTKENEYKAQILQMEQESLLKLQQLNLREQLMKEKEDKINAQLRKQEEKSKLLAEREKLMKILNDGKQKKNERIMEQKDEAHQQALLAMEAKFRKEASDASNISRLEALLNTPETTPVPEEHQASNQEPQYSKIEMEEYLRGFFAPYDHDWSGYITSHDFHTALLSFPDGPSDAVATQLVKSVEKEGYCCYEEFVQNYISEIGIEQDEPYDETKYQEQQEQQYEYNHQQQQEKEETYVDPYAIPCAYCIDQEGAPATHTASAYGHAECLEAYLTGHATTLAPKGALDSSGRTALFCGSAASQFNCVALLLQDDDSPAVLDHQDFRGDTAIHASSSGGANECLQLLLQSGAEVDIPNRKGQLATHVARDDLCLQTLIDHSGDVFGVDNVGRTTVFTACSNGRVSALRVLLDLDQDMLMLNLNDDRGDTPLHAASCNGHTECVRLLLQTMADPSIQNGQGLVPGYLAECNGHISVVELLEEYKGYTRQTDMSHAVQSSPTTAHDTGNNDELSKWAQATDETGVIYYWHSDTGESAWEPPVGWNEYHNHTSVPSSPINYNSPSRDSYSGSPIHGTQTNHSAAGSPLHPQYQENDGYGYWGQNGVDTWVEGDVASYQHQNWDQTATEGYEYTNEWEEYWQWYGYEQQEEAPRGDQEDEWQGYYDDEGNWIDTSIAIEGKGGENDDGTSGASGALDASGALMNLETKSEAVVQSKPKPKKKSKLNKDYQKMADGYSFQSSYRVSGSAFSHAKAPPMCLICNEKSCSSVLLPCEHRSVCDECIKRDDYGITVKKGRASVGGGTIKIKPKPCPACRKRVYKVVTLDKFFILPRDYGPAPRLAKSFATSFQQAGIDLLEHGKESNEYLNMTGGGTHRGGGSSHRSQGNNEDNFIDAVDGKEQEQKEHKEASSSSVSPVKKTARIPLVVEFGPGRLGLELVPIPNQSYGSVVNSVTGVAEELNIKKEMRLLKVNNQKVDTLPFPELMKILQNSSRPIKMLFL